MKTTLLLVLLVTTLFSMNNYNKGVKAYNDNHHKDAISYWMPYAIDNHNTAQYLIATIYFEGKADIKQNYTKAMEWYVKSASSENSKAQIKIALMYCEGNGVLISYKKAIPYVEKAYVKDPEIASEIWKKYKLYNYE